MSDGTEARQREIDYWTRSRREQGWHPIDVQQVLAHDLTPCYAGTGDYYSENRAAFHDLLRRDGGWTGKHVLDYACGSGNWAIYFALTGAQRVTGFDINADGVELARERAAHHELGSRVRFEVADASSLPFPDGEFDIVIGTGVLHHVIKYENVFEQLHRVLRPGAKAYFVENLADFPLWRLWWKLKGEVPEGDVPIFAREVRERARMFERVEIVGDTFLHSVRPLLYRQGMGKLRRAALRLTHKTDEALFAAIPALRRWGSFSYITLTK
jgi:SAM-dependent methyltransferase